MKIRHRPFRLAAVLFLLFSLPLASLLSAPSPSADKASSTSKSKPSSSDARASEPDSSPERSPTPSPAAVPLSDGAVPRARALELAEAFENEGYKTRDGFWFGIIEPNKPLFLEVNLYAGNHYWFFVGADDRGRKLSVTVYDESGTPEEGESYQDESTAAAGWIADASGKYYIKLELLEGSTAEACFVYAYK